MLNLDDAFGILPPKNGRIVRNLIQAANYIQSHILHFYHLAALDYVKGPDLAPFIPRYEGDNVYRLPKPINDTAVAHYIQALDIRKKAHQLAAIFGAKAPHSTALLPGGVTSSVTPEKIDQYRGLLEELTAFVDNVYIPDVLAVADVYNDYFTIGAGCKNLLAWGVFPLSDTKNIDGQDQLFKRGRYTNGEWGIADPAEVREHVMFSRFEADTSQLHPSEGKTVPQASKAGAYSWIKAPRYAGLPHEVGPLARMWVNKEPGTVGLSDKAFSVLGRHYARAVETSLVAHTAMDWLAELEAGQPCFTPFEVPKEAKGMGLTEAPRGALGHWIEVRDYVIHNYQCVVPTTWNCSPRDDDGVMGPVEQALIGTPVADPDNPIELVRVVRSFDPCLACAIHLLKVKGHRKDIQSFRI